ncbi:glycosyltransferase family 8 protein [Podospora appendiculata]|uniref:glycogenin glucosyltransferase n=1 Tax=Podospora appendiculata TaxID=314037 RepID=A0AAE0X6I6_9PEZI|nr:glycosyltransferase family 8 protein [Podospora appendiculata]
MNRPDLHSAFTKINLWKQTQFRKIVYLDADIVAYRAPDELFDLPHAFSAAPDIGWPDLFNTGVMVLTPSMGEYYALRAMTERGISFDGADQGLLNMHFKNTFNRISFTYNVTPSAHYQYVPAYRHFQSSINMVHFIGPDKPWVQGRDNLTGGPFDDMTGRWWAVYDRHYRVTTAPSQPQRTAPALVQYFVKGEYQPTRQYIVPVGEHSRDRATAPHGQQYQPPPTPVQHQYQHQHQHQEPFPHPDHGQHDPQYDQQHEPHHEPHHEPQHDHHRHPEPSQAAISVHTPAHSSSLPSESFRTEEGTSTEAREGQESAHEQWATHLTPPHTEHKPEPPRPVAAPSWDAQRHPPPSDSQPEAIHLPQTHYVMSSDPAPFVPPERYPSPPKNMWYEVPKEPPAPPRQKPKAIFPWETNRPQASRVFAQQEESVSPVPESTAESSGEPKAPIDAQPPAEPSMTESTSVGQKSEPQTPTTPSDPWSSFTRTNAWDEVPQISRYVDAIQKHRRTRSQGLGFVGLPATGLTKAQEASWGKGSKVTDFPSEEDRPSLPVTPAPIRRPRFWGGGAPGISLGGEDDDEQLPAASGVPTQSDWVCVHGIWWTPADCLCDLTNVLHYHKDPVAQLQKLATQQSNLLLQKLGGSGDTGEDVIGTEGRHIPSRPLPFGSEGVKSPTYGARSSTVLSPKPIKPDSSSSSVRSIVGDEHDEVTPAYERPTITVQPPSYQGPGASFEKGEEYATYETPAPPTEEEQDVLET